MLKLFRYISEAAAEAAAFIKAKAAGVKNAVILQLGRLGGCLTDAKNRVFHNRRITAFAEKCSELARFLDDNRKISYPVILLVYTIIVVAVTTSVNHGFIISDFASGDRQQLSEQLSESSAYNTVVMLEQGQPRSVGGNFTVTYEGCRFDKTVTPSKAEKFGAYYENNSDANLYMDVMLTYTNTSDRAIGGDEAAKMVATCAGVDYNCFTAVETEQGTNFVFAADSDISAGESVLMHYIFDVPATMKTTNHDIVAELVADNKTYYIDIK